MKRSNWLVALALAGSTFLVGTLVGQHQPTPPATGVVGMQLPLKLPAVGNIQAVQKWRFGRLEDVERTGGPDIVLRIRTGDGTVLRTVGPAAPLGELARESNWVATPTKSTPTRTDYVERMIAFDVDGDGRLIAMMSLETINRNANRLRRALGPR